jgi:hypothetical protein
MAYVYYRGGSEKAGIESKPPPAKDRVLSIPAAGEIEKTPFGKEKGTRVRPSRSRSVRNRRKQKVSQRP